MRNSIKLAAAVAALGLTAAATPASAAIVLADLDCNLATGCLFDLTGGSNVTSNPTSVAELEAAYNDYHEEPPLPAEIDLSALYQTAGSLGSKTGTFTLPGGGLFNFYALKAANQFILYQVAPTNSVDWDTVGMLNNGGKQPDGSHIVAFWGNTAAVPEPATWAMMIGGFAAVGSMVRRRRTAVAA